MQNNQILPKGKPASSSEGVVNLVSFTNNMENSTGSILENTTPLSSDTLKDAFIHMDETIRDFPDLKKLTVALKISRR